MKAKELQEILHQITTLYPHAKLRFEGSEYIYTSDKEKERCEWSYKKIESVKIELEYDNDMPLIVIKL